MSLDSCSKNIIPISNIQSKDYYNNTTQEDKRLAITLHETANNNNMTLENNIDLNKCDKEIKIEQVTEKLKFDIKSK